MLLRTGKRQAPWHCSVTSHQRLSKEKKRQSALDEWSSKEDEEQMSRSDLNATQKKCCNRSKVANSAHGLQDLNAWGLRRTDPTLA